MKMEIPALAEEVSTLAKPHLAEGDVVQEGDRIAAIS
jgi:biotin carboxyl carrier protein